MERKANKGCVLASLDNLSLPGANEETSFNIVSCVNSQQHNNNNNNSNNNNYYYYYE